MIAGADEAGRGALAGPVVAAAVILPSDYQLPGLTDSKKLTASRRDILAKAISRQAVASAIIAVDAAVIDQINILQASLLAMKKAIEQLQPQPHKALIDGNKLPDLSIPAVAVIGGDNLHACISAASILAKVERDRQMVELDKQHHQYGFAKHKGYPTARHRAALLQHGPCPQHRRSYAPVQQLLLTD